MGDGEGEGEDGGMDVSVAVNDGGIVVATVEGRGVWVDVRGAWVMLVPTHEANKKTHIKANAMNFFMMTNT